MLGFDAVCEQEIMSAMVGVCKGGEERKNCLTTALNERHLLEMRDAWATSLRSPTTHTSQPQVVKEYRLDPEIPDQSCLFSSMT